MTKLKKVYNNLKQKWEINSDTDVFLILLVFSLAGMSVLKVNKVILSLVGITKDTPMATKVILYILLIMPVYQILLLVFGALLGQFRFFWEKEKKMMNFFKKMVTHLFSSHKDPRVGF